MVRFFIDRPIFAWVIAIILMLAGILAIRTLPVTQYPSIAPPAVQISARYPGASAKTVEDTVTQVIEQQMNGLDHLMYLSSVSDNSGGSTITLTFVPGTNPDIAQVQVQNNLQLATRLLPSAVQQQGIKVSKSSGSFLMVMAFVSTDGRMNKYDLANYVASNVQDSLSRVDGVGTFSLFGSQYAMRIWLNPDKLTSYSLTPTDVQAALTTQNVQVAAGQLGGTPSVSGQQLTAAITESSLLNTPEQFAKIVLRANQDGSRVLLSDVARIELGGEDYSFDSRYNRAPTVGIGIQLATGANALQTAKLIREKVNELSKYFPAGVEVKYPFDVTPFVKLSIEEVIKTLLEGIALVFLVMFLFLQNFRATLIPTIAVPVVLLGTFAVMSAAGFSINTLSMFGMVLAIGLLVDDAIVVVENVERVMAEEGLSPRDATRKAMDQITGALVGVALVLSAVFVPMAFSSGSVGAIYRQFSLTIVSAMVLSVFVALILTPALCATLLKPIPKGHHAEKKGFFGWFNRSFESSRNKYQGGVKQVLAHPKRWFVVYGVIIVITGWLFMRLPTSFLPEEDQGILFVLVQTPPGSTQQRTQKVLDEVSDYYLDTESKTVESVFAINGFSFAGNGQNAGLVFVKLKDWKLRHAPELKAQALLQRSYARLGQIKDAMVFPVNPPAIMELGTAGGFNLKLQDRSGLGHVALMQARNQLLGMAAQSPLLTQVRPNGMEDTPQFHIEVDREKASVLGVPLSDIDQTFSIAWAMAYVNNFLDVDNRVKKVLLQADAPYRMNPEDISHWYVRNKKSEMVPLSALVKTNWTYGSPKLERYNGVPSVEIQGAAAPGKSTGDAMQEMQKLAGKLPVGIGYEWTGVSLQELLSGSQAPMLYAISILVVFLSLAALYESWSIPFAVILVVPLGIIGALLATTLRGLSNDVYFQVGLLTTVGLAAKNAILIVEFAKHLQEQGKTATEAAIEAARLRLRPILMTSMAFILGVLPLVISRGAGAGSQHAIGTGVVGGMLTATFLAIFIIPLFFVVIQDKFSRGKSPAGASLDAIESEPSSETEKMNGVVDQKGPSDHA